MDWTTNARNINNETVPISMYVKSITFEDGKITVTAVNGNEAESKDYAVLTMSNTAPTLATVGIKGSFWVHKHDNINDLYYLFNIETSEEGLLSYIWNKISGGVVVDTAMSTTSTNPVENQAITKAINEIRNVAEGKNKGYVLSNTHDWQYVKSNSSTYGLIKWINNGGVVTDITSVVKDPSITVQYLKENYGDASNSYFAINVDEITINSNLIIMEQGQSQIAIINTKNFKIGDVFYVIEKNVPDRWTDGSFNFYALETKSDLGNYYTKAQTDEKITGLTNNIDDEIDRATAEEDRLDGLIDSLDSTKAGTEYVNTELAKKAGTEYVNTELAKKVNTTLETNKLYGTNGTGAQTTFKVNVDVEEYSVAYRGVNGTLKVATPTNNDEATPKSYVNGYHDSTKQDTLTFDETPTASSNNPVKSKGIKTAIDLSKVPFTDDFVVEMTVGGLAIGTHLRNKTLREILKLMLTAPAGFYDDSNNLVLDFETSGIQIDTDYDDTTRKTGNSGYKIIKDYNDAHSSAPITKVILPNTVTKIGAFCFAESPITYITIPDSVKTIGNYAFKKTKLMNVIIPNTVENIGTYLFYLTSTVTSATIGDRVTELPRDTFNGCSLTEINLSDNLQKIGLCCFACNKLTSVSIPKGVIEIANNPFGRNTLLTTITVDPENTVFYSEGNCVIERAGTHKKLRVTCNEYSTVPNDVTNFYAGCYDGTTLTEITVPASVSTLYGNAFENSNTLTTLHIKKNSPAYLTGTFSNVPNLTKIYVPSGSLSAYQSATNWSAYASIMEEE